MNFYARPETESGIQTAVHLSFQPGVQSGSAENFSSALGRNQANFRQVFLTFGNDELGTFKIGRDLGVSGSDAILNDMTLLGVGMLSDGSVSDGHTSNGRIDVGYLYADWKAQLQYQLPSCDEFSFTVAVVDPWAVGSSYYDSREDYTRLALSQEKDTPGFAGKINYAAELSSDSGIDFWAGFIYQKTDFSGRTEDLDASKVLTLVPGCSGRPLRW